MAAIIQHPSLQLLQNAVKRLDAVFEREYFVVASTQHRFRRMNVRREVRSLLLAFRSRSVLLAIKKY